MKGNAFFGPRFRKTLRPVLGVLLGLAVFTLVLGPRLLGRWAGNKVRENTGWTLKFSGARFVFFRGIRISGIELTPPDAAEASAGAAAARMEWRLSSLLAGGTDLDVLILDEPWCRPCSGAGARVPGRRAPRADGAAREAAPARVSSRFRVGRFEVRSGLFEATSGGGGLFLGEIDMAGRDLGFPPEEESEVTIRVGRVGRADRLLGRGVKLVLSWGPRSWRFSALEGELCGGVLSGGLEIARAPAVVRGEVLLSHARPGELLELAGVDSFPIEGQADVVLSGTGPGKGAWPSLYLLLTGSGLVPGTLDWARIPIGLEGRRIRLGKVRAGVAGGTVKLAGEISLPPGKRPRGEIALSARGVALHPLFRFLAARGRILGWGFPAVFLGGRGGLGLSGRLDLESRLYPGGGPGGLSARGRARLMGGRAGGGMLPPEFEFLLAGAPAGGEQPFERASAEFELFGRLLRLRDLEIFCGDVRVFGEGSIELSPGGSLDLDLELDFPPGVSGRLGKDLRGLFEPSARRPGGLSVSLRLSGPLNAPRTDLLERAARRVAQELGGEADRSEWEARGLSLLQELLK